MSILSTGSFALPRVHIPRNHHDSWAEGKPERIWLCIKYRRQIQVITSSFLYFSVLRTTPSSIQLRFHSKSRNNSDSRIQRLHELELLCWRRVHRQALECGDRDKVENVITCGMRVNWVRAYRCGNNAYTYVSRQGFVQQTYWLRRDGSLGWKWMMQRKTKWNSYNMKNTTARNPG